MTLSLSEQYKDDRCPYSLASTPLVYLRVRRECRRRGRVASTRRISDVVARRGACIGQGNAHPSRDQHCGRAYSHPAPPLATQHSIPSMNHRVWALLTPKSVCAAEDRVRQLFLIRRESLAGCSIDSHLSLGAGLILYGALRLGQVSVEVFANFPSSMRT
ncbi:hypothetical protein FA95DRAFT_1222234 [Auriscalpium vulgare]|uniref:Uncharacterized protein n=1 Tax=Auriscalpium vulgare TaxID=40419 RepID=A0ACB8RV90_9AGAM|nr:hypothetical protein FA95DRAFT_1222234 [Auriscalpium vulgare]